MDSILNTIKKKLGPGIEHEFFDDDIITEINSALSDLASFGVGPEEGFFIEDDSATWEEFIGDFPKPNLLNNVKRYVYLSVKLIFDPPTNSSVLKSYENTLAKLEWKLNHTVETEA